MLAMLFIAVVIDYMSGPQQSRHCRARTMSELHLDPKELGWVMSAFGWAYATLQIPGGWLVDRIRPRLMYALICGLWSLATMLHAGFGGDVHLVYFSAAPAAGHFRGTRLPHLVTALATTSVSGSRTRGAIATYTAGQFLGPALFLTLLLVADAKTSGAGNARVSS